MNQVDNEIKKLEMDLSSLDFSKDSNKQAVFEKTCLKLNHDRQKGDNILINKSKRIKTAVAAAILVAFVGVTSIAAIKPAFAQQIISRIISSISLGHINAVKYEYPVDPNATLHLPDELKGKVFDSDGKAIDVITKENAEELYTADGTKILGFTKEENGEIKISTQEDTDSNKLILTDSSELKKYLCFEVKLPNYLPDGYTFEKAELYKDEKGVVDEKYVNIYFKNSKTGKTLYMQQSFACEETAYMAGTDGTMEKIQINGVDAVVFDSRSIDWENNNVLYFLSGRGEISKAELIKIAESI
jgi:hypothetical protein